MVVGKCPYSKRLGKLHRAAGSPRVVCALWMPSTCPRLLSSAGFALGSIFAGLLLCAIRSEVTRVMYTPTGLVFCDWVQGCSLLLVPHLEINASLMLLPIRWARSVGFCLTVD